MIDLIWRLLLAELAFVGFQLLFIIFDSIKLQQQLRSLDIPRNRLRDLSK